MKDEIKEIDNSDLMELLETTSKKEFYRLTLDHELVVRLYNWITNLQEEIERLKREKIQKELCESLLDECDAHNKCLQQRIDKAIEYINKNKHLSMFADCRKPEEDWNYVLEINPSELLNILQGEDKDE